MKFPGAKIVIMSKPELLRIGVILVVGGLIVLSNRISDSQDRQSEIDNIAYLHSLRADAIESVSIFDKHGRHLRTITNPDDLAQIAAALNSTQLCRPNHPNVNREFSFSLNSKKVPMLRLNLYTVFPANGTMYMEFYLGGYGQSGELYNWMKGHEFLK